MKLFKGFDKNLCCRGFQYEKGKEYCESNADLCKSGFHACENPIDVFSYYPPSNSRYCEVDLGEVSPETGDDSKRCGKKIKVGAEIGIKGIIKAAVKFTMDRIDWENSKKVKGDESAAIDKGDHSAATNKGFRSIAINTGDCSAAISEGPFSATTNIGDWSVAISKGDHSAATSTGYCSAATNEGFRSVATNTGLRSAAINKGTFSAATNTGDQSAAISEAEFSVATNTGDYSAAVAEQYKSAAVSVGEYSTAISEGKFSAAVNMGDRSVAVAEGGSSIAFVSGINSKAKGALGCFIVVAEWYLDNNYDWQIKDVKAAEVDGEKIKADTFYMLKDGEFVEVEDSDTDE